MAQVIKLENQMAKHTKAQVLATCARILCANRTDDATGDPRQTEEGDENLPPLGRVVRMVERIDSYYCISSCKGTESGSKSPCKHIPPKDGQFGSVKDEGEMTYQPAYQLQTRPHFGPGVTLAQ